MHVVCSDHENLLALNKADEVRVWLRYTSHIHIPCTVVDSQEVRCVAKCWVDRDALQHLATFPVFESTDICNMDKLVFAILGIVSDCNKKQILGCSFQRPHTEGLAPHSKLHTSTREVARLRASLWIHDRNAGMFS